MKEELRTLCHVQRIDTSIMENERKRLRAPKQLEAMDKELTAAREKVTKEKEIIDELDKERKRKEKDLDTEKEKIAKIESKLHEVKTNKEYQAVLKEIEGARAANDKVEEEIILLLERIEELKKDYTAAQAHLTKREKEIEVERKAIEAELASVTDVITKLKKERDKDLAGVSKDVKSRYNILLERRGGVAVVNVKNGVCLGCFMNIPPQLFIEATKNEKFITCPSCNRIFCYTEEE